MVFATKGLDRESKSQYVITIIARDNAAGSNRLKSNTTVIINVLDINDNQPVCLCPKPLPFSYLIEDDNIAKVNCTDSDIGENGDLNYEIYAVVTDVKSGKHSLS